MERQAKLDAIYDEAYARARAAADARWELTRREMLLDAHLRYMYPTRHEIEFYAQPVIFFGGPHPMQPIPGLWY
jgi:hypothetical protein